MVLILLAAGLELSKELLDSELMEPDDMPALMSAVDYVLTFLEEFTSQSAALTARHQRVRLYFNSLPRFFDWRPYKSATANSGSSFNRRNC